MKNTKKDFVVSLIVIIAVLGLSSGLYYLLTEKSEIDQIGVVSNKQPIQETPIVPVVNSAFSKIEGNEKGTVCYNSPSYFVIEKMNTGAIGAKILVKYKTSPNQTFSCVYSIDKSDFEINDESYFLSLTDNFIILDSGTGPLPRGLTAINLQNRKREYQDRYGSNVSVRGDVITYMSPVDIDATLENCPKLDLYISEGFSAIIENLISVDLNTLIKKNVGETQCVRVQ